MAVSTRQGANVGNGSALPYRSTDREMLQNRFNIILLSAAIERAPMQTRKVGRVIDLVWSCTCATSLELGR